MRNCAFRATRKRMELRRVFYVRMRTAFGASFANQLILFRSLSDGHAEKTHFTYRQATSPDVLSSFCVLAGYVVAIAMNHTYTYVGNINSPIH